jgi:hypothetical protein
MKLVAQRLHALPFAKLVTEETGLKPWQPASRKEVMLQLIRG